MTAVAQMHSSMSGQKVCFDITTPVTTKTRSPGSPGPKGMVLTHPFEGKYYDYRDPRVPVLAAQKSPMSVVLTLPPGVPSDSVKWLSVWCRQFAVDFGHVIKTSKTGRHHGFLHLVTAVIKNICCYHQLQFKFRPTKQTSSS